MHIAKSMSEQQLHAAMSGSHTNAPILMQSSGGAKPYMRDHNTALGCTAVVSRRRSPG
jgi:hypothetical protein